MESIKARVKALKQREAQLLDRYYASNKSAEQMVQQRRYDSAANAMKSNTCMDEANKVKKEWKQLLLDNNMTEEDL